MLITTLAVILAAGCGAAALTILVHSRNAEAEYRRASRHYREVRAA